MARGIFRHENKLQTAKKIFIVSLHNGTEARKLAYFGAIKCYTFLMTTFSFVFAPLKSLISEYQHTF
jgi:hypothetical protein